MSVVRMKRFLIALVIVVVVGALCGGLIWFNFFRDQMISQFFANFPVPTVTISTIAVEPQRWTPGIDAVGTISASKGIDIAVQAGGIVMAVDFKANDKVAKGQVLVEIDAAVERAGLLAARSTVAMNQDAFDRAEQLVKRNVSTAADLQTAQNKLDQAKGALAQVEATIAQKELDAPFAGTVGIPRIEIGQYVQPGTVVATLQDLETMKVSFTVPEQQLPQLAIGQTAVFGLTEDKMNFPGKITGIDPKIDPNSRLVSVEALIDQADGALRPGQFVRVRVNLPEEPSVIALPQTAVTISLYGSYVYEVTEAPPPAAPPPAAAPPADDSGGAAPASAAPAPVAPAAPTAPALVVRQIFVETGRRSGNQIEILKGVTPGMQIVTSGQNKLSNGSHVKVDNSVDPAKPQPQAAAEATP